MAKSKTTTTNADVRTRGESVVVLKAMVPRRGRSLFFLVVWFSRKR